MNWRSMLLSWKGVAVASLLYFAAKILLVAMTNLRHETIEDYQIAQNMAAGYGYCLSPALGPTAVKVPVYPLFLAAFVRLFGDNSILPIVVVQHALMASVPLLLFYLGCVLGMRSVGLCAAYLFMLHPSYFYYPNVIEVTNLVVPLLLMTVIACVRALASGGWKQAAVCGALSGVLLQTQPVIAPCVVVWTLLLAIKRRWMQVVVFLVICMVVMLPWNIRNMTVFHRFIPTKSPVWMNMYMGYMTPSHGKVEFDVVAEETKNWVHDTERAIDNIKMEPHYKGIFLETVRQDPLLYIRKTVWQAWVYWWVPARYQQDHSMSFLLVRKMPVIVLNIVFVCGMVVLLRENFRLGISVLLCLLYFTVVYAAACPGCIRYKLDIEWLELLPVGALCVYFRRNGMTSKRGPLQSAQGVGA